MVGNPLLGGSEGDNVINYNKRLYKDYAQSSLEGSMGDVRSRSRSKSKKAKLEEKIAADQRFQNENLAFLARKQQHYGQYDMNLQRHKIGTIQGTLGTLHRSDSNEALPTRNFPPYQNVNVEQTRFQPLPDYNYQASQRRPGSIHEPAKSPNRRMRAISGERSNDADRSAKKQ